MRPSGKVVEGMVVADLRIIQEWTRRYPLIVAFTLSLLIHGTLYSGWRIGHALGWWDHQATWLLNWKKNPLTPSAVQEAIAKKLEDQQKIIPLTFVEVPTATAAQEEPKEAKYYSTANALATSPEPSPKEADQAKLEGTQDKVIRLADNPLPKPKSFPLQPALPPEETARPEPEQEKAEKPEEPPPVGNQAQAKPKELTMPSDAIARLAAPPPAEPKKERPRTLAAARGEEPTLAGNRYKQEGSTRRRGSIYSPDVKASPFGAYDLAFIRAVEARWFSLLDSTSFVQRSGKVVVAFKLNADGRISELSTSENEVGEILGLICERAILDPAPYAPWPNDMRRMVGDTYRDIKFTFFYH